MIDKLRQVARSPYNTLHTGCYLAEKILGTKSTDSYFKYNLNRQVYQDPLGVYEHTSIDDIRQIYRYLSNHLDQLTYGQFLSQSFQKTDENEVAEITDEEFEMIICQKEGGM